MKKISLIILALTLSFCLGFAFNEMLAGKKSAAQKPGRATGIGGIFFKCKDPKKMREWYQAHLRLNTNQYGAVFEWRQGTDTTKKGFTQWSPFGEKTKYFAPSEKDFMINYRVENLEEMVREFKHDGIVVTDTIQSVSYGKFVHIMDMEGNKLELWEPNDLEYDKMGKQMGARTTR